MGRITNPLTGTQKNDKLFAELCAKIKGIGVRKLGSYGFISHETINNYCRRKPVNADTESLIHKSIAAYEEEIKEANQASISQTMELLSA